MARGRRIILNGVSGLSLLIAGLLAMLWGRSFWKGDYAFRVSEVNWTHVTSSRGRVEIYWKTSSVRRYGPQRLYCTVRVPTDLTLDPPYLAGADMAMHRRWAVGSWGLTVDRDASDTVRIVVVPYGVLVFIFGSLPLVRLTGWYRRSRRQRDWMQAGCCLHCGYDLRASGARCPECGSGTKKMAQWAEAHGR